MDPKSLTVAVLLIALLGCTNEDVNSSKLLIKEINDPLMNKDIFEYDDGKLVRFTRFVCGEKYITSQLYYTDDRLTRLDSKWGDFLHETVDLSYDENGLRQNEKWTVSYEGEISYREVSFNYEGAVLTSKVERQQPNTFPKETLFEWKNGNLIRMDVYFIQENGERHFSTTFQFTYDNKRNWVNQELSFAYVPLRLSEEILSVNNVTGYTINFDGTIQDYGNYIYTYNTNGYPSSYQYKIDSRIGNQVDMIYE